MIKTIIITGSTDGIGKLAAIQLAKEGHEIYLHGRNATKLARVIAEVKELSDNTNVKGFVADFSDLEAVKRMGQQIINEVPKVDVLINNAGVFKSATPHSKEDLDIRFVVNYLAPYVLTNQLLPLLRKGTETRILNLSSAAQATVSQEALMGHSQLTAQEAYAQSKLALTMWSFHLAKTLEDISVIAVNPGSLLNTNMVKEAYGYHWASADKGADILCKLAVSTVYRGVTGKYFDNDQGSFGLPHTDANKQAKIDQLIATTNTLINL